VTQSGARDVALRIVLAWDSSRQTADVLLDRLLARAQLSPRDHDLVIELVRGIFRWRGRLDWQLESLVDRPLADLHPPILWILRMGLYQLTHLDRIPAHAAVSSSVDLAKRYGHRGSAALVNAVLRRAPERIETLVEPDAAKDPVGHLAVRTSHPRWMLERWLKRFGFSGTLKLAARNNERPQVTLRAVGDRAGGDDLLADLRGMGIEAESGLYVPETVRIPGGWHPRLREILEAGIAIVQDEGAALAAIVSRPVPKASVLDVCSAPGGKAIHFALLCGEANVVAADRSLERLRLVKPPQFLAEHATFHFVVADGRHPAARGPFSRVLVDAPCTNTGVLGRRPDAKWRREPGDLSRLSRLQGEILDASRELVSAGGLLVYSTCSLESEENEGVIQSFLERHPSDTLLPASDVLPEEVVRGDFLCTNPTKDPIDGAFAAVIQPKTRSFPMIHQPPQAKGAGDAPRS
jgi:16S rRNA (cytosine967-C5)-methyltransferase